MSRDDRKAPRVRPHCAVLVVPERDEPVAAELAALAAKDDRIADMAAPYRLVDPAQDRLVPRDAPLGLVVAHEPP